MTTDALLSTAASRRVGDLRALDSGGLIRVRETSLPQLAFHQTSNLLGHVLGCSYKIDRVP